MSVALGTTGQLDIAGPAGMMSWRESEGTQGVRGRENEGRQGVRGIESEGRRGNEGETSGEGERN